MNARTASVARILRLKQLQVRSPFIEVDKLEEQTIFHPFSR
ncbi:MAG TPA: hypothetical protein V6D09_12365 [Leptolyngbyaceae cyanobacterium]